MRTPTPKQQLVSHIRGDHRRQPARSMTFTELGRWHSEQHYRYSSRSHIHAGPNLGPDTRPPGWRTGADVVPLDGRGYPTIPLDGDGWPIRETGG